MTVWANVYKRLIITSGCSPEQLDAFKKAFSDCRVRGNSVILYKDKSLNTSIKIRKVFVNHKIFKPHEFNVNQCYNLLPPLMRAGKKR